MLPAGFDEIPTDTGRLILTAKRFVAADPAATLRLIDPRGTIVCLNPERELQQWPNYPRWLVANQPDRAIWFSMPDWQAPPLEEALVLLDDLAARLGADRTVIMHCSHGQGRTGTIAIATLMLLGADRDEATEVVARHRPGAGPASTSQAELIDALSDRLSA